MTIVDVLMKMANKKEILTRSKDKCVICGEYLFQKKNSRGNMTSFTPSKDDRITQMSVYGNWCSRCDSQALTNLRNEKNKKKRRA